MTTQLNPMTYEEAMALVIMLDVPKSLADRELAAAYALSRSLVKFLDSLPGGQRQAFQNAIDDRWPTHSFGTINYQEIWAVAIEKASQVQVSEAACAQKT